MSLPARRPYALSMTIITLGLVASADGTDLADDLRQFVEHARKADLASMNLESSDRAVSPGGLG